MTKKHKKHLRYKNFDVNDLKKEIYNAIGYVKLYIEHYHRDIFFGSAQHERVEKLIFWLGKEVPNHMEDNEENRHWYRKWLYLFEDETENMC